MEKKSNEQLKTELSAPLPTEAIKPHPTKTYLSSIKAIYVTERMNDVFGLGRWNLSVDEIERGDKGMVVVKAKFSVPDYGIYMECYGGNDNGGENSKNFDLGDAYKGATTDAITKIGSYLEIGIDVFKGKVSAPKTTTPPPAKPTPTPPAPPVLPVLEKGTDKYKQIVDGLADGLANMERVKLKNILTPEIEKAIEKEVKAIQASRLVKA